MIKEIKYFIFLLLILLFLALTGKYYFSDANKKNSYRSLSSYNEKIETYSKNLPILKDNTKDIIQYVEKSNDKKKKKFNFWKLLENNE